MYRSTCLLAAVVMLAAVVVVFAPSAVGATRTVCPDGGMLCQKPQLVRAKRKQRKITLTVAALPPGAFLHARVRRRWHNSTTASLSLRVKHWRRIVLRFGGLDGARSPTLTITPRTLRRYTHR